MQITINDNVVQVNGTDWKELSAGKKMLYAVLIPIILLFTLIVVIFAISIGLGAVAIALPFVLVVVVIACIIGFLALFIGLPIALFKRKS